MAKSSETVHLSRNERLRGSPAQSTSMQLPLAVHHRLTKLADAAEDVAASRAEIIGMLIAEAEIDTAALERSLLDYRRMTVGDILPPELSGREEAGAPGVVRLTPRRPGRPRRTL